MWKYQSNDIDNISLHDHLIDDIVVDGNNILLVFPNGFDVVNTHALNDTGKSKLTGNAQIVLESARFLSGAVYSHQNEKKNFSISMLGRQFSSIEVLEGKVKGKVFILHGNLHRKPISSFEYMELSFFCEGFVFCWNEYVNDSWFENFPHKNE